MRKILMMDGIVIEKASLKDVDAIIELYSQYRKNWKPSAPLGKNLDQYPAFKVLGGDDIIGFAYCYSFAPDILELANIYIDEQYRSNNIGADLITMLEGEVLRVGYNGLILINSDAYEGKVETKSPTRFICVMGMSRL